jgi:TolB-like protein
LQDITETGEITISDVVFRNVKNKPGKYTAYIREKSLNNVDEPVKVYRVSGVEILEKIKPSPEKPQIRKITPFLIMGWIITIIAAAIFIWNILSEKPSDREESQAGIIADKSLAVLPFRNDSPNPEEEEWFGNGMLEGIMNVFWKIGDLKVLSRTDVEPYRDTSLTLSEIAEALGVAYLIEGSFTKLGNSFRMSIQLIVAKNGYHLWSHLWSDQYDRELGDDPTQIFQIQKDIAKGVASALHIVLTTEEKQRLDHKPSTNLKAYELWVRGRQEMTTAYWREPGNYHTEVAMDMFNEALAMDPDYPDALTAKGEVFLYLKESKIDSAIYYCNMALKIDPELMLGFGSEELLIESREE